MYKNDACILTADDIYKLKTPLYIYCLLGSFRFYIVRSMFDLF